MKEIPLTRLNTLTIKDCIECEANRPIQEMVSDLMQVKQQKPEKTNEGGLTDKWGSKYRLNRR